MTRPPSSYLSWRGPYGFLIAAALGVVGLVGLGTWQLDRLSQKESIIAERQNSLALPPLDLTRLTDSGDAVAFRRVTVFGRFLHEKELRVGPATRRGRAGWHVIVPFERADGGMVLVDRGWVPSDRKEPRSRLDGQVAGQVTLTGFINRVAAQGPFAPDNDPAKGDWYRVDPAAMAAHLGLSDIAPYWIVAARDRDRDTGPIGSGRVTMPANNHLIYAITWYALAAALSVLAFVYWHRASFRE